MRFGKEIKTVRQKTYDYLNKYTKSLSPQLLIRIQKAIDIAIAEKDKEIEGLKKGSEKLFEMNRKSNELWQKRFDGLRDEVFDCARPKDWCISQDELKEAINEAEKKKYKER